MKYKKHSSSWKSDSRSASQEISPIPLIRIFISVFARFQLDPVLSQTNPVRNTNNIAARFTLTLPCHLCLGLCKCSLPSRLTKRFCAKWEMGRRIPTVNTNCLVAKKKLKELEVVSWEQHLFCLFQSVLKDQLPISYRTPSSLHNILFGFEAYPASCQTGAGVLTLYAPYSAKFKNAWNYISSPLHDNVPGWVTMHKDSFTCDIINANN
jgi:hypothetical protein